MLRPCRPVGYPPARRFLLILSLGVLLGGCGLTLPLSQAAKPTHTYTLAWQGGAAPPAIDRAGPNLLVSPIHSAPGFNTSDMAYIRQPHEIEYFAHHRWVDAPARMLESLLVQAAEHSGLFHSVAEAGTGAQADLRLDSKLLHLQQVCRLNPSELQLALRVTLVKVASARVIASRTLSVSEPLDARTPYAGVKAADRAVARLLSQFQVFLKERIATARR